MSKPRKPKPYKSVVMRKGKMFCPCRHCDGGGWDSYMLQGDLWSAVLPPDVSPSYHAGFICLRCAIESIDRPLCREDITGCMTESGPTISDGDFEVELRFPKRGAKRRIHAIHLSPWCEQVDDPVGKIMTKFGWLLDRLAIQAKTVIVRQGYCEGRAVTLEGIRLA